MENKQDGSQWYLVRNENGEWIDGDYAIIISEEEVETLSAQAARLGLPLSIQHGPYGTPWCYKHEIEALEITLEAEKKLKNLEN